MASICTNTWMNGRPYPSLNGNGTISNVTTNQLIKKDGTPTQAKFYILDRRMRKLIVSGTSNTNGEWEVTNLNENRYYQIITVDEDGVLNASILDWIQPQVL